MHNKHWTILLKINWRQSTDMFYWPSRFPHSAHSFHVNSFLTASLLHLPDGDLAVSPGGAAQDVAVLGRAQCLDAVCVSLQLLGDSVALWLHDQQLASLLTATRSGGAASTTAAHPHLTPQQIERLQSLSKLQRVSTSSRNGATSLNDGQKLLMWISIARKMKEKCQHVFFPQFKWHLK